MRMRGGWCAKDSAILLGARFAAAPCALLTFNLHIGLKQLQKNLKIDAFTDTFESKPLF